MRKHALITITQNLKLTTKTEREIQVKCNLFPKHLIQEGKKLIFKIKYNYINVIYQMKIKSIIQRNKS